MENLATMPSAAMAMNPPQDPTQTEAQAKVKTKDHWFVEVVGGFTLATTMVSALSVFYVWLQSI